MFKPLALAVLLLGTGAAQATITVYTDEASFLAALSAGSLIGTDTFDDLVPADALPAGPLSRSAGGIAYTAQSGPESDVLYGAGSGGDAWLSTNVSSDSITFSGFSPNVYAAGGHVFGSDVAGAFLRRGSITFAASSLTDSASDTQRFARQSNFVGFISDDAPLTSLTLTATSGARTNVWPTVDDLVLASAVPEPETYALLLSGLAVVGFLARRRRAD